MNVGGTVNSHNDNFVIYLGYVFFPTLHAYPYSRVCVVGSKTLGFIKRVSSEFGLILIEKTSHKTQINYSFNDTHDLIL